MKILASLAIIIFSQILYADDLLLKKEIFDKAELEKAKIFLDNNKKFSTCVNKFSSIEAEKTKKLNKLNFYSIMSLCEGDSGTTLFNDEIAYVLTFWRNEILSKGYNYALLLTSLKDSQAAEDITESLSKNKYRNIFLGNLFTVKEAQEDGTEIYNIYLGLFVNKKLAEFTLSEIMTKESKNTDIDIKEIKIIKILGGIY